MPTPVPRPSDAELLELFAGVVGHSLRIDPARVVPATTLDALGAESLDIVEITLEVENAFGILMPERTILETGAEVLGEGVLEMNGHLTDAGRRLLAARMPDVAAEVLSGDVAADVLRSLFLRVETWLRVIRFVLDHSPRVCPACGTPLVTGRPACLRCPSCGIDVELPTGDDLNREWVRAAAVELGLTSPR